MTKGILKCDKAVRRELTAFQKRTLELYKHKMYYLIMDMFLAAVSCASTRSFMSCNSCFIMKGKKTPTVIRSPCIRKATDPSLLDRFQIPLSSCESPKSSHFCYVKILLIPSSFIPTWKVHIKPLSLSIWAKHLDFTLLQHHSCAWYCVALECMENEESIPQIICDTLKNLSKCCCFKQEMK